MVEVVELRSCSVSVWVAEVLELEVELLPSSSGDGALRWFEDCARVEYA